MNCTHPHDAVNAFLRSAYRTIGEVPPASVCPPGEVERGQVDLPRGDRFGGSNECILLDTNQFGDTHGKT